MTTPYDDDFELRLDLLTNLPEDIYQEMDQTWYNTAIAQPVRASTSLPQGLTYESHELYPRFSVEGWRQLEVGYVPIGRRDRGGNRQLIVPIFVDHRLNQFSGWYLIIEGEDTGPYFDERSDESYHPQQMTTDVRVYVKRFETLGQVFDNADNPRGFTKLYVQNAIGSGIIVRYGNNPTNSEPEGFYSLWIVGWMPRI